MYKVGMSADTCQEYSSEERSFWIERGRPIRSGQAVDICSVMIIPSIVHLCHFEKGLLRSDPQPVHVVISAGVRVTLKGTFLVLDSRTDNKLRVDLFQIPHFVLECTWKFPSFYGAGRIQRGPPPRQDKILPNYFVLLRPQMSSCSYYCQLEQYAQ